MAFSRSPYMERLDQILYMWEVTVFIPTFLFVYALRCATLGQKHGNDVILFVTIFQNVKYVALSILIT